MRLLIVLGIILIVLQGFILYQNTDDSANNYEYEQTLEAIDRIRKENLLLRDQILQEESFSEIIKKAEDAGFVPAQYIYIK